MDRTRLKSVDSTQKWLRDRLATLQAPACVIADEQTAGHGQFDRRWLSPPGGLYLSIYFTLDPGPGLEKLAQEVATKVAIVLEQRGYAARMRWPNDLLIDGKKVGGVLCEVISGKEQIDVIVGVGINLKMEKSLLERIDQPASALEWCEGELPGRDELADEIIECLGLEPR